jgi:hypothetical protein
MKLQIFVMVAAPVLAALAAAGLVLTLKLRRRSEPPTADDVANVVPVEPLAAARAARWKRNYGVAAMVVLTALVVFALLLYASDLGV